MGSIHQLDQSPMVLACEAESSNRAQFSSSPAPRSSKARRRGAANVSPAGTSTDSMKGTPQQAQQLLMESEDRRIKQLTEAVLYEFLPAALNVMLPHGEETQQELDVSRCRAVAGAALSVACLLNAPPGFLEFLLCVPWRKLTQLYPKTGDSIDKLISNLHVSEEERKRLVNVKLEPSLMRVVLDFLYRPDHVASLPPMLALTAVSSDRAADLLNTADTGPLVTAETVAALLDGATPLHCAALRGNPAQVEHLLHCGAICDVHTTAGELPIQLVPVCSTKQGIKLCRCTGTADQEKWACKSHLARRLIASRCIASLRTLGFWPWLQLLVLCVLCLLGVWGNYTSICRPGIEQHVLTRRERKRQGVRMRAQSLIARMRAEAKQGQAHLAAAKQEAQAHGDAWHSPWQGGTESEPPDRIDLFKAMSVDQHSTAAAVISTGSATAGTTALAGSGGHGQPQVLVDLSLAPKAAGLVSAASQAPTTIHDINVHLKESEGVNAQGEELPSELAFKCFVRAVHSLQSLDLQGETIPQVLNEPGDSEAPAGSGTHVLEDEQAELYSGWAESVMLKFGRTCTCPGCAALAAQAVRMAHSQASKLFQRAEQKHTVTSPERVRSVGVSLARVVHVYMALLLDSEAQSSSTRAAVWRAEQCLKEWDRLSARGLTTGFTQQELAKVQQLRLWARTADSDLYIAEALLGSMLSPSQTLQDVLAHTVGYTADNKPYLLRTPTTEFVVQLEQALTLALLPSPSLSSLARALALSCAQELSLSARLREIMAGVRTPGPEETAACVGGLMDTLKAAEAYPRLAGELSICRGILAKWIARADAAGKLMTVIDDVRQYTDTHPLLPEAGSIEKSHLPAGSRSMQGAVSGMTRGAPDLQGSGVQSLVNGSEQPTLQSSNSLQGENNNSNAGGIQAGARNSQQNIANNLGSSLSAPDLNAWDEKLKQLEHAIEEAKDATIGVAKAKRLLKELQAQVTAAKAASQLETVLARRPAGAAALKAGLAKAEGAASGLSSIGLIGCGVGQTIQALLVAAKRRLEVERALEALNKATNSCKAVGDLPRLEAAIINARKVGAEDLDPDVYKHASDQRARLHEAARARAALDAACKSVQKGARAEDAEGLEQALAEANKWEDLLAGDLTKAREVLAGWRNLTASEAKLNRALSEGASLAALSRAIADAAAAGVKVHQARRVLKLLQGVEQALSVSGEGPRTRITTLRARIEAAEQADCVPQTHPIMVSAQHALRRLLTAEARDALESALKQVQGDARTWERLSQLRAAYEKAEEVVGKDIMDSVCKEPPAGPPARRGSSDSGSGASRVGSDSGRAAMGQMQTQPSGEAAGSDPGKLRSNSATSQQATSDGNVTGQGQAGSEVVNYESGTSSAVVVTISDDDADMAMLLALAKRAAVLMAEEQQQTARLDAERAAVERERRERERDRQERARAEQERKQRQQTKHCEDAAAHKSVGASIATKRDTKAVPASKQGKGSKAVKVDLASISASSHFSSTGVASMLSPGRLTAADVVAGGHVAKAVPPPPPPPPPAAATSQLQRKDYKQAAELGTGRNTTAVIPSTVVTQPTAVLDKQPSASLFVSSATQEAERDAATAAIQQSAAQQHTTAALVAPLAPPTPPPTAQSPSLGTTIPASPRLSPMAPAFVMPSAPSRLAASTAMAMPGSAAMSMASASVSPMASTGGAACSLLDGHDASVSPTVRQLATCTSLASLGFTSCTDGGHAHSGSTAASQHNSLLHPFAGTSIHQPPTRQAAQQPALLTLSRPQMLQLRQQNLSMSEAIISAQRTGPAHARKDSLECLGDPTLQLDKSMLAALDMLTEHVDGGTAAATERLPHQPGSAREQSRKQLEHAYSLPSELSHLQNAVPVSRSVGGRITDHATAQQPHHAGAAVDMRTSSGSGLHTGLGTLAGRAGLAGAVAEPVSQQSSKFSSATSTDDVLSSQHLARTAGTGATQQLPAVANADVAWQPQVPTSSTSSSKPRFNLVDLGGLSWGINDKGSGTTGTAPLCISSQSNSAGSAAAAGAVGVRTAGNVHGSTATMQEFNRILSSATHQGMEPGFSGAQNWGSAYGQLSYGLPEPGPGMLSGMGATAAHASMQQHAQQQQQQQRMTRVVPHKLVVQQQQPSLAAGGSSNTPLAPSQQILQAQQRLDWGLAMQHQHQAAQLPSASFTNMSRGVRAGMADTHQGSAHASPMPQLSSSTGATTAVVPQLVVQHAAECTPSSTMLSMLRQAGVHVSMDPYPSDHVSYMPPVQYHNPTASGFGSMGAGYAGQSGSDYPVHRASTAATGMHAASPPSGHLLNMPVYGANSGMAYNAYKMDAADTVSADVSMQARSHCTVPKLLGVDSAMARTGPAQQHGSQYTSSSSTNNSLQQHPVLPDDLT